MSSARLSLAPLGIVAFTLGACAAPVPSPSPSPSASAIGGEPPLPSPLPDIVARLDGEPIYMRQLLPLARAKLDRAQDLANEKPARAQDLANEKPALMREALQEYINRELLLREAMSRGVEADTRQLQRLYDTARAEYTDEDKWKESLWQKGLDPESFKVELRVQQTVGRFLAQESNTEASELTVEVMKQRTAVARALLDRLRSRTRIETYL